VFNRPGVCINDIESLPGYRDHKFEEISISQSELFASADSGCEWCLAQWQDICDAYMQTPGSIYIPVGSWLSIWLGWTFDTHGKRLSPKLISYHPTFRDGRHGRVDLEVLFKSSLGELHI